MSSLFYQINKYTGPGAYKLLSKGEADKVMSKPHHFINSQLVENTKSKSTPIRTVLDGTSYNHEAQTSVNAIMHKMQCKQNRQNPKLGLRTTQTSQTKPARPVARTTAMKHKLQCTNYDATMVKC